MGLEERRVVQTKTLSKVYAMQCEASVWRDSADWSQGRHATLACMYRLHVSHPLPHDLIHAAAARTAGNNTHTCIHAYTHPRMDARTRHKP